MTATTLRTVGELGMIRRIRDAVSGGPPSGVRTGIGDDTAVLALTPGASLLATTDLLIEDVHFRRSWASPYDIGWKTMAVNLSDIAAMGGIPRWALVALALPSSVDLTDVDALYRGLREAAAPHGVVVVGGDSSASPSGWMIDVTLLGEHTGTPKLRSAAKAGDAVAVTGTLGQSAAGLALLEAGKGSPHVDARTWNVLEGAHLRPTPRLAEGRWLGNQPSVHAMIDLSDGLTTDLGHICRESGVGARVELEAVPVAAATNEAARALGVDLLEWATGGGEDYELLLTCEPGAVAVLSRELLAATGTILTVIGRIEAKAATVTYLDARGNPVAMRSGYQHFDG